MAQIPEKLRRCTTGFAHYCPGCDELHILPTNRGWTFNGDLDKPTFSPSFLHQWNEGPGPARTEKACHYILTDGVLNFCGDCTHALSGKSVPLPDLPEEYRDFANGEV